MSDSNFIIKGTCLIKYIGNERNIIVPDGITRISGNCFSMTKIDTITLPNSVEEIGRYAFAYCKHLSLINLVDNIKSIGDGAFRGCKCLMCFDDKSTLHLPENLEYLGSYSFANTSIKHVVFHGNHLKSISKHCFAECTNLSDIKLPDNILKIETCAFNNDTLLQWIKIPDSTKSIGPKAFGGCISLKRVYLPIGVENLDYGSFMNCHSLESVHFRENLSKIGDCSFKGCISLKSFYGYDSDPYEEFTIESDNFKSNLAYIGKRAFEGCISLKHFFIPKSLKLVDDWAFRNSGIDVSLLPTSIKIGKTHKSLRELWMIENAFDENDNLTEDAKDLVNRAAEISNLTRFHKGAHLRCIPFSLDPHPGYCWSTKHIVLSKEDEIASRYFNNTTTIEELEFLPNVEPFDYEIFIKSRWWELDQLKYKKNIGEIEFYPTVVKRFVVPAERLEIADALRELYGNRVAIKQSDNDGYNE